MKPSFPCPFTTRLLKFSLRFPGLLFLKSFERATFVFSLPNQTYPEEILLYNGQRAAMDSWSILENWTAVCWI